MKLLLRAAVAASADRDLGQRVSIGPKAWRDLKDL
jgi:hypothetical protein